MTKLYITMPQPGETITEGTLVSWLVKVGDTVEEGTPLAELETEKAIFDYESPFQGVMTQILKEGGSRVKVASPLAVIDVDADKAKTYIMMGIAKEVDGAVLAWVDTGVDPYVNDKIKPQQKPISQPLSNPSFPSSHFSGEIKMSPHVRKLATENRVPLADLKTLAAQNAEGRVTIGAIENFVTGRVGADPRVGPKAPSVQSIPLQGDFTAIACSAIRLRIAENMVLSKSKIPHAHNGIAVDVTNVEAYRQKTKDEYKTQNGTNLNFLTLIQPALVAAMKKYPLINSSYHDANPERPEIHVFNKINLGVAVGTEYGLVIPVIPDVAALDTKKFNAVLNDKIARAQSKKLKPDDLMGATLIFNNFGFFGTQMGVQVIQYPLAATLGMSVIEKRVVPIDDKVSIRTCCDFVLAFDHRVMDGRETGLFLSELKKQIESLYEEYAGS
jgi:2-oxoisovalerate dehydrogenase E2 component (dihydrolipoyl transacylase)